MRKLFIATITGVLLAGHVLAQDASHYETATSKDSSDWGLLGLLGLIGLLGLKKKKYPDDSRLNRNL